MDTKLRDDLMCIVLEEAFGMQEHYARKIVAGGIGTKTNPRFRSADQQAWEAVDHIMQRFEARCSKIEG